MLATARSSTRGLGLPVQLMMVRARPTCQLMLARARPRTRGPDYLPN